MLHHLSVTLCRRADGRQKRPRSLQLCGACVGWGLHELARSPGWRYVHNTFQESSFHSSSERLHQHHLRFAHSASERTETSTTASAPGDNAKANPANPAMAVPLTNGLDLDLEEVGVDTVPYPRKLALIKQLAKSVIIGWESPLVPAGWGSVFSFNIYVDDELRLNVPFGAQTKAVLERLDLVQKVYRIAVQCLTERGNSDQLRCSILVGRDVSVAPTHLRVERIKATSASLTWLPSNSKLCAHCVFERRGVWADKGGMLFTVPQQPHTQHAIYRLKSKPGHTALPGNYAGVPRTQKPQWPLLQPCLQVRCKDFTDDVHNKTRNMY